MPKGTIISSWTQRAVVCAEEAGLDVGDILLHAGITLSALEDPTGRVEFDHHADAVTLMAKRLDDPGVGLDMGARSSAGDFGVVSLLAETCSTLRDALEVVHRFNAVANQASLMAYWVDRGRLFIQDGHLRDGRAVRPVLAEATLAFWATMIRQTCAVARPFAEVWFAHERHRAWTPTRLAHFDAKLCFGRPINALVLPAELLDARFASSRPELSVHLATLARRLESDLTSADDPRSRLAARVRRDLTRGELLPLERAARALGTSARTLQRDLRTAGLTYREVVDNARRELAPALLADPDVKVETVAKQLGYADARSFRRACLRWFGKTPGRNRDLACR